MQRSQRPADYQHVPRPVAAMARNYPDRWAIGPHHHPRAQLIHAVSGVMLVETAGRAWLIPPGQALWMPAGVPHQMKMSGLVSMKTLYIDARAARTLPRDPVVVQVTTLLRELIVRATELPVLYDRRGHAGRLMQLLFDELAAMQPLQLSLPLPRDRRLRRLCDALRADLSRPVGMAGHARDFGMTERTLARAFRRDLEMTFGQWHRQLRLLEATRRLAAGAPVATIAAELGYSGPSAFTAMFRRALGMSPRDYRRSLPVAPA